MSIILSLAALAASIFTLVRLERQRKRIQKTIFQIDGQIGRLVRKQVDAEDK